MPGEPIHPCTLGYHRTNTKKAGNATKSQIAAQLAMCGGNLLPSEDPDACPVVRLSIKKTVFKYNLRIFLKEYDLLCTHKKEKKIISIASR